MESLVVGLRALHVVAGCVALLVMAVPLLAAKGGRAHRRAGWVFVVAMGIVCASGLVTSGWRIATETRPGVRAAATFLFYVSILAGAAMIKGMRVLRQKHRTGRGGALDLAVAGVLTAAGVVTALVGLRAGHPLVIAFGALGAVGGGSQLRYWLYPPRERMHWWYEHMGDMGGTCIAALTAFAVANARSLGLGGFSLWVWLLPTVIGTPLLVYWGNAYRRRFEGRAVAEAERAVEVRVVAS
jgi:uncharacterized membrane protein